jgi:serine/threonine protein kinase
MISYMTTNKTTGTLRWQAPELIPDMTGEEPDVGERRNSIASDVYAYALVCHEVNRIIENAREYVTERCDPTNFLSPISQVTSKSVKRGKRPPRPTHELSQIRGLNDEIWRIIEAGWNQDPDKRPTAWL